MLIQTKSLWAPGLLSAALLFAGTAPAETAADGATPGNWQQHKYTFHFMGFTSAYSCEGLEDKLRLMLQMSGAGPGVRDIHVDAPCDRGIGRPDRLAMAYLTFSTLQPTPSAGNAPGGVWRHVAFAPGRPFEFDYGDCELIEEFRDKVLPMFATRNLTNNVTCVPYQDSGSNFYLSYDAFALPVVDKVAAQKP
jgi:hypothetical protein